MKNSAGIAVSPSWTFEDEAFIVRGPNEIWFEVDGVMARVENLTGSIDAELSGQVHHVIAEYDMEEHTAKVTAVSDIPVNFGLQVPLFRVIRTGTNWHVMEYQDTAKHTVNLINYNTEIKDGFKRLDGLVLTAHENRRVKMSAGRGFIGNIA